MKQQQDLKKWDFHQRTSDLEKEKVPGRVGTYLPGQDFTVLTQCQSTFQDEIEAQRRMSVVDGWDFDQCIAEHILALFNFNFTSGP